jgi:hypothetical protein
VEDGHRSDKRLHGDLIDRMVRVFSEALRNLVYVAEATRVTNLAALAAASAADAWAPVGRGATSPSAATYWASEQAPPSGTGPISPGRVPVVASRPAEGDQSGGELAQARAVERAADTLAAQDFACAADATAAGARRARSHAHRLPGAGDLGPAGCRRGADRTRAL